MEYPTPLVRSYPRLPLSYAQQSQIDSSSYKSTANNVVFTNYQCLKCGHDNLGPTATRLRQHEGFHAPSSSTAVFNNATQPGCSNNGGPENATQPVLEFLGQTGEDAHMQPEPKLYPYISPSKQAYDAWSNYRGDTGFVNHGRIQETQNNLDKTRVEGQPNKSRRLAPTQSRPEAWMITRTESENRERRKSTSDTLLARIAADEVVKITEHIVVGNDNVNTSVDGSFGNTWQQQRDPAFQKETALQNEIGMANSIGMNKDFDMEKGIAMEKETAMQKDSAMPQLIRIRDKMFDNQQYNKPVFAFEWQNIESAMEKRNADYDEYIGDLVDLDLLRIRRLRRNYKPSKRKIDNNFSLRKAHENTDNYRRYSLDSERGDLRNNLQDSTNGWSRDSRSNSLPNNITKVCNPTLNRAINSVPTIQRTFPDYKLPDETKTTSDMYSRVSAKEILRSHVMDKGIDITDDIKVSSIYRNGFLAADLGGLASERLSDVIIRPSQVNGFSADTLHSQDGNRPYCFFDSSNQSGEWNSNGSEGSSSSASSKDNKKRDVNGIIKRTTKNRPRTQPNQCLHLWEFLLNLLNSEEYCPKYIAWTQKDIGEFKLIGTDIIANLWGQSKKRKKMTYEKMARALRYYYKHKVLEKVPHKRLHFRFSRKILQNIRNNCNYSKYMC